MFATILTFPLPRGPRPAQQRVDDRERVMDYPVFYDEPHMHTLIASLDDGSRLLLKSLRIGKARAFHCFRPISVLGIQGQNVLTNGRIRLIGLIW